MIHAKILRRTVPFALLIAASQIIHAAPLGTAFSYQGQLTTDGVPASGNYDLVLALFDDPSFGSQVGSTVTNLNVAVSNGLFTTTINFGAGIFNGTAYWLAIGVRSNGSGTGFTALSPRQPVTPTPYALYATVAPLADGSVTSTTILDGTVVAADLAPNSVNSGHIIDGQVANVDLANNAVNSAKVLDGSLVGADMANNTVTSVQLADDIDLGTTNVTGRLDVYRTSANTAAISLIGSSSQISTFGSDGLEQIRLWGAGFGEIYLYDSSTNNRLSAVLSANGTSGGFLSLRQGNSTSSGAVIYGDNLGGGRVLLYDSNVVNNVDIRGQYDSVTAAAWGTFKDSGSERISFAARNGTSGRGGLIDVKNNSSLNTIRLIGDTGANDSSFEMYAGGTNRSLLMLADDSSSGSAIYLYNGQGQQRIEIDSDDGDDAAIIRLRNSSNVTTITLDGGLSGDGRITTQELQITGGSDLSEQFDITSISAELKPGMIVCIDQQNPGQLIPSTKSYDRTVAGVISGAGGVKPGMLMGQKGTKADGQHPVALTGRVYCWMDATQNPVEPGDLITTSDTPGHAMKVADHAKAQGAIIGKAMTSLKEGKGLVLMLVSLQ